MSNPWDIPPFPLNGDKDESQTHEMASRALTEWEEFEYQLSYLYAFFVGMPPPRTLTMRKYGQPRTFTGRAHKLEVAAEPFFISHPDQTVEGKFRGPMTRARLFANRRNEIAHGVVRPLQMIYPPLPQYGTVGDRPFEYALMPPICTDRKIDEKNRPIYIYTAAELKQFALAFYGLSGEVNWLALAISRKWQP